MRRSLISASLGPEEFRISGDYLLFTRDPGLSTTLKKEQVSGTVSSKFSDYWTAQVFATRDLGSKAAQLSHGARIFYEDECFRTDFECRRDFYTDRDVRAGTTFLFAMKFKHLGTVSTTSHN